MSRETARYLIKLLEEVLHNRKLMLRTEIRQFMRPWKITDEEVNMILNTLSIVKCITTTRVKDTGDVIVRYSGR